MATSNNRVNHTRTIRTRTTRLRPRASVGPILLGPGDSANTRIVVRNHTIAAVGTITCRSCGDVTVRTILRSRRHLDTTCPIIVIRNTNSPTRVGLHTNSVTGVNFTRTISYPIILVTSVGHNKIFTRLINALRLLSPARRTQIGNFVVGHFHNSVTLLRPNLS